MWDETNAVKRDHTIRRETCFPLSHKEWILSGPHFYVGNPFYKTPRAVCTEKGHYDVIDHTNIPDDYFPRTNYLPDCEMNEYLRRTPKVPWNDKNEITECYRLILRAMISIGAEKGLVGAIYPKQIGHTNACRSYAFHPQKLNDWLIFSAFTFSIPFDFMIKLSGRTNLHQMLDDFPLVTKYKTDSFLKIRCLTLSCLTIHYADLWNECWDEEYLNDRWAKVDSRLSNSHYAKLAPKLYRDCAVRTDYARRQVLIEIDVLASMALGLTLEELKTIYRVQFPVMRQYEADTWYDQNGRIVFTNSKGLSGVGLSRPEWNDIKDMKSGTVKRTIIDDTMPGGPYERTIVYEAPFDRCDRETDYETAWKEFERRFGTTKHTNNTKK